MKRLNTETRVCRNEFGNNYVLSHSDSVLVDK